MLITRKFIFLNTQSKVLNKIQTVFYIYSVSVPETWARYTEENIRRALSEISQSDELLNLSNQLMTTSNNDIWSQWNHVNVSLENRVQEEQIAKNKIQGHLEKVVFTNNLIEICKYLNFFFLLDSSRNL